MKYIVFLFIIIICSARAAIIHVPSPEHQTIQAAVDVAIAGDTVLVDAGTYQENLIMDKNILVSGKYLFSGNVQDISNTIIDGKNSGTVVQFKADVDSSCILNGFTIQNGFKYPGGGGGISCINESSPTLKNIVITDNVAGNGGGIFCYNHSDLNLYNVKIISNRAVDSGGGIFLDRSSNVRLKEVILDQNVANEEGGGIFITDSSQIDFNSGNISGNLCGGSGGGIYLDFNSFIRLENLNISANFSEDYGGGIYASESSLNCRTSIFMSDTAIQGGAIFLESCDETVFTDTKIIKNHAKNSGGGVYLFESDPEFISMTISQNSAQFDGGGIYSAFSSPIFNATQLNNIYSNHSGANGTDLYSENDNIQSVIVDTFTTKIPDAYFAFPMNLFSFIINSGKVTRSKSNLYINPVDGDDTNNGTSDVTPLKTIATAIRIIDPDSSNRLTIFLNDGVYSSQTNNEIFPVNLRSNLILTGNSSNDVTLNAGNYNSVLMVNMDYNSSISDLTLTGGNSESGGGIMSERSNLSIKNTIISGNTAYTGGAISCINQSYLYIRNSTISANKVSQDYYIPPENGGIYIQDSKVELANSILWDNEGLEINIESNTDSALATIAYSDIAGDSSEIELDLQSRLFWLGGNISEDPLFRNLKNTDYRLTLNSPCIDAAASDTNIVYNFGIDTLHIPPISYIGFAPDMGAIEFSDPSAIAGTDYLPDEFRLFQNYPNPFNPNTIISWQLAVGGDVEVSVYNLLGQKVVSLVSERQKAGHHQVEWDASSYASGVYYYRLVTDAGLIQTKKLLLIR